MRAHNRCARWLFARGNPLGGMMASSCPRPAPSLEIGGHEAVVVLGPRFVGSVARALARPGEISRRTPRIGRERLVDLAAIDEIDREQPGGEHSHRERGAHDRKPGADREPALHAALSRAIL